MGGASKLVFLSGRDRNPADSHARDLDDCIESARQTAVERLVASSSHGVSSFDIGTEPSLLSAFNGSWKKLGAVRHVAQRWPGGADGLLLWHDADTVPIDASGVSVVERARRIAALQPGVDLWMQPGEELVKVTPDYYWHSLEGVSLASLRHLVWLIGPHALQAGVLLVRGAHSSTATDALRYRHATRGQLGGFYNGEARDQGPLTHHLLQRAERVRLVG
mmetsp:Transcript_49931/g.160844  ORF Transcript_49931/g.160844 Transcript_49931/m.160844 type:complete len:220 (+) Transcript_49931:60-719(+)